MICLELFWKVNVEYRKKKKKRFYAKIYKFLQMLMQTLIPITTG